MTYTLHTGDCRDVMATLPAESVDAIVCDPPYGLSFMGKGWDHGVPGVDFWVEALRVLKPGGHIIAFGGTRTYHRLAVAIEDAGFEVRDCLMWLYGSGFPKSLDVSKAMDKQNYQNQQTRAEKQTERRLRFTAWVRSTGLTSSQIDKATGTNMGGHYTTAASQPAIMTRAHLDAVRHLIGDVPDWVEEEVEIRTLGIEESEAWKSRKVVSETRVDMFGEYEVEKKKTAGMGSGKTFGMLQSEGENIKAEKILSITAPSTDLAKEWHGWGTALKPAYEPAILARKPLRGTVADNVAQWGVGGLNIDGCRVGDEGGRWPANVILDEDAAAALDAQSGVTRSSSTPRHNNEFKSNSKGADNAHTTYGHSDIGGASRFFYTAKASRSEREAGLDGVEQIKAGAMTGKEYREDRPTNHPMRANHHPTVKPIALMRYMIRLVAPRGAVVLDPFMGSGSTGCAAMVEGMQFIGIDITPEYVDIARRRIAWWSSSSPLDNTATMELHEENDA
jgi:DNA modification methylase